MIFRRYADSTDVKYNVLIFGDIKDRMVFIPHGDFHISLKVRLLNG